MNKVIGLVAVIAAAAGVWYFTHLPEPGAPDAPAPEAAPVATA